MKPSGKASNLGFLNILTFSLGCFTVTLSAALCLYFFPSRKAIGKSVAFMLFGEFISGFCTLLFTGNSLLQSIDGVHSSEWSPLPATTAMALRWTMFLVTSISSVHLAVSVLRILRDED